MTQTEFKQRLKEYTNDTVELITPYVNKKTYVKIKCKKCGYIWEISPATLMPSSMKKSNFSGCPECKYETIECDYCHKIFKRLKSEIKTKSGYNYCSKECGNRHKNKLITNWDNSVNYRRNAFNIYPHKCSICGYDEDERILEVHHLDENHNNNDIKNLIILCPNCHKKITLHLFTYEELLK